MNNIKFRIFPHSFFFFLQIINLYQFSFISKAYVTVWSLVKESQKTEILIVNFCFTGKTLNECINNKTTSLVFCIACPSFPFTLFNFENCYYYLVSYYQLREEYIISQKFGAKKRCYKSVKLNFIGITCMHARSLQLCLTLCDSMDLSPPGSSVHGIFQARRLEWVTTMHSSRGAC